MASFSGLGMSLSLVFGFLLLALVAELYYLLFWKRKKINSNTDIEHGNGKNIFCWKNPSSANGNTQEICVRDDSEPINGSHEHPDPELGCSKDLVLKTIEEEGVEAELMRLHNLAGPPRFLFTITEETREDLESEDGKSRKGSRTRSLSDLVMSPMASPPLKSYFHHHGFNPLLDSETELNRLRSSPPPTFKFLRDAEEKLYNRLMEEIEKAKKNYGSESDNHHPEDEQRDGSFFNFIVGKNKEREIPPSQVLPLSSSPTALRPVEKKSTVH